MTPYHGTYLTPAPVSNQDHGGPHDECYRERRLQMHRLRMPVLSLQERVSVRMPERVRAGLPVWLPEAVVGNDAGPDNSGPVAVMVCYAGLSVEAGELAGKSQ